MPFTPVEGTIGGLLIGISSAAHLYLNGRISGMSGTLATCIKPAFNSTKYQLQPRSFIYLFGLIVGGLLTQIIAPQNLPFSSGQQVPVSVVWFAIAGLLVGYGTQLACGCTSGHMICGLARLSKRSFVAVLTFCAVAFLEVKLLNTPAWFATGTRTIKESFIQIPPFSRIAFLLVVFVAVLALYALLYSVKFEYSEQLSSFVNAVVFGLGLGISGMTNPLKVLGFFDVGGENFDPSLVCVAMGATMFDMILFNGYILKQRKPVFANEFCLPTQCAITSELVIGSALFGLGWGLLGICPGPAVVNLTSLSSPILVFFATFSAGVIAKEYTHPSS